MSDYHDVLSDDERQFLNHISHFGSDGYPVAKRGSKWWWHSFRSIGGSPVGYKTKRAAYAAVEAYHDTLLDRMGRRAKQLAEGARGGELAMKTIAEIDNGQLWLNTAFKKRDYECTNIVAARGDQPKRGGPWVEATEAQIPAGVTSLHIEGSTRFLGWL